MLISLCVCMKKIIVANWKMNPVTLKEAEGLVRSYIRLKKSFKRSRVIVCPPFVFIPSLAQKIKTSFGGDVGAQNVARDDAGAHTGEVSARMLKSVGASFVIIGHSERRMMGDTDDSVHEKIHHALKAGLSVIFAVGESERGEDAHSVLRTQLCEGLRGVSAAYIKKIFFAYEPRWAISKGVHDAAGSADTPKNAIEKAIYMRRVIAHLYDARVAKKAIVLYGGSVRAKNAALFMHQEWGFDGALIGGASLDPHEFANIASIND